jgi:phospholipid/cholesterol/gamma-HCH transport system substrate-binding protein
MQRYTKLEILVGAFIIAGSVALAYLSVSLGGLKLFGQDHYALFARFSSVGGLKQGDPVKISGVSVGQVAAIRLVDFRAEAELAIEQGVKLPADTIAAIDSNGLLGDAYVTLSPGGAEEDLAPGAKIARTEAAVSFTELISKYAFGSPLEAEPKTAQSPSAPSGTAASASTDANAGQGASKPSPFADPLE